MLQDFHDGFFVHAHSQTQSEVNTNALQSRSTTDPDKSRRKQSNTATPTTHGKNNYPPSGQGEEVHDHPLVPFVTSGTTQPSVSPNQM